MIMKDDRVSVVKKGTNIPAPHSVIHLGIRSRIGAGMFSISPSNGRREQLGGERGKYGDWEKRRVRYEPYGERGE